MEYTIKEVANKTNLSTHTIRYYEKEGLLPKVSRNKAGNRVFSDDDLEWISIICCLKNTGMAIKDIKTYIDLKKQGDSTLEVRRNIVTEHKKAVENKISQLMKELKKVNEKVKYYDRACEDGTEAFVKNKCIIQKIRMK